MCERQLVTIDCETDPFKHGRVPQPFLWDLYDGLNHLQFEHTHELARYLATNKLLAYAHNGGRFDFHYLIPWLNDGKILLVNGRIVRAKLGETELRDSYAILPVPLRAYKKDVIDYQDFEADRRILPEVHASIVEYLKHDTQYLYELVVRFRSQYGNAPTLAGSSIKALARIEELTVPKGSPSMDEEMRSWYFGGRVEAIRLGRPVGGASGWSLFDIRSAYPYAMTQTLPWGTDRVRGKYAGGKLHGWDFYTVHGVSKGAFPLREDDGGIYFPRDNVARTYKVTGWELIAAQELRLFKGTIQSEVWFPERRTFAKYVGHFYKLKAEAEKDSPERLFAKLFLNSCYGKLGANPEEYEEVEIVGGDKVAEKLAAGAKVKSDLADGRVLVGTPLRDECMRYYNVATAASVTGFVRAYLLRGLQAVRDPIYCDTDSILCGDAGKLECGEALGAWAPEGTFQRVTIAGKKLYALYPSRRGDAGAKIASKGARLTVKDIERLADGSSVTWKNEAPTFALGSETKFLQRELGKGKVKR